MVSRCGKPEEVVTDNGNNFVAADKELQELVKRLDQNRIIQSAANRGIKWHFNQNLCNKCTTKGRLYYKRLSACLTPKILFYLIMDIVSFLYR